MFIFIFGCAKSRIDSDNAPIEKGIPGHIDAEVCYPSNTCLPLIANSDIQDPDKAFKYNNPNDFPTPGMRPQYQAPIRFADLSLSNTNDYISKNFYIKDFGAIQKGRYAVIQRHLIDFVQAIRNKINGPLFVNSGYRSPAYNSGVDGSANWSRHTFGDAVDIYARNTNLKDLQKTCDDLAHGEGFSLLYKTHVHCDLRRHQLDEAYYGPTNPLPLSIFSEVETAKIVTIRNLNSTLSFSVTDIQSEDDAELVYDWKVILPNGKTLNFDTATPVLPALDGIYHTEVTVGGSIHVRQEISWSK